MQYWTFLSDSTRIGMSDSGRDDALPTIPASPSRQECISPESYSEKPGRALARERSFNFIFVCVIPRLGAFNFIFDYVIPQMGVLHKGWCERRRQYFVAPKSLAGKESRYLTARKKTGRRRRALRGKPRGGKRRRRRDTQYVGGPMRGARLSGE